MFLAAGRLGKTNARQLGTLPFGVQKRVELARALVARPRLLLLDEPMARMTATEKAQVSRFILEVRESLGSAVVLIEHDIGVVMRLSDRVTVLERGRRIAHGTPAAVNERDGLGDETPPDYLTSVQDGGFYGWPYSYWGQTVDERVPQDAAVARAITPDYTNGLRV